MNSKDATSLAEAFVESYQEEVFGRPRSPYTLDGHVKAVARSLEHVPDPTGALVPYRDGRQNAPDLASGLLVAPRTLFVLSADLSTVDDPQTIPPVTIASQTLLQEHSVARTETRQGAVVTTTWKFVLNQEIEFSYDHHSDSASNSPIPTFCAALASELGWAVPTRSDGI